MAHLTLVPAALAKEGATFRFRGANDGEECQGCPYRRLCFALDSGRTYRVAALRDVTHPCNLHEGRRVRVAEVEEVGFATSLESHLLRGTATTWSAVPCGRPDCGHYALCHPVGALAGARHAILETGPAILCPAGYTLTRVVLKPLPKDAVTGS
ncbi:MAG TPA: UPF0179 family protein [Candidatus Thermoplasmatota archaeon]|nr:UPF0179 family protein [Candidatus Thermoplasmatota archaeon]